MGNQAEEITQSNHSLRQGRGREAQECAGSAGRGLSGEVPSPRSPAAHGAKGRKSVSRANKRKCEGPGVRVSNRRPHSAASVAEFHSIRD